jgi:hypothetical protein
VTVVTGSAGPADPALVVAEASANADVAAITAMAASAFATAEYRRMKRPPEKRNYKIPREPEANSRQYATE